MKEEEEGEQLLNTEQCEECVEAEVVNEPKKTTWYTKAKKCTFYLVFKLYPLCMLYCNNNAICSFLSMRKGRILKFHSNFNLSYLLVKLTLKLCYKFKLSYLKKILSFWSMVCGVSVLCHCLILTTEITV